MNFKAISVGLLSLYIQSSNAYIPSDLKKIKQADDCIGCDLT